MNKQIRKAPFKTNTEAPVFNSGVSFYEVFKQLKILKTNSQS